MSSPKWAYGVTTVPSRRDTTLPKTLESLARAGFPNPRLFVDGSQEQEWLYRGVGVGPLEKTLHDRHVNLDGMPGRLCAYGNWLLGLIELYLRHPTADRYAMFQDDILLSRNVRPYLDTLEFSGRCYWNLMTFPDNQNLCPNGHIGFYSSNQKGRGATALVFSPSAVRHLLLNCNTWLHAHRINAGLEKRMIDRTISISMYKERLYSPYVELVHSPSLVEHQLSPSTLGNDPWPKMPSWRGEDFDCLSLLKEAKNVSEDLPLVPRV